MSANNSLAEIAYQAFWDELCAAQPAMKACRQTWASAPDSVKSGWRSGTDALLREALRRMGHEVPPSLDFFEDLPAGPWVTPEQSSKLAEEAFDDGHEQGFDDALEDEAENR